MAGARDWATGGGGRGHPKRLAARAYAFAEGDGPQPREYIAAQLVSRFGAQAVFGRQLGMGEMRRILVVENVINAYHSRARAENWAQWAAQNPDGSRILNAAMKAYTDGAN